MCSRPAGSWCRAAGAAMNSRTFPTQARVVIIGGGVSKKAEKFLPLIDVRCPVKPARLFNDAGIVGAALLASR